MTTIEKEQDSACNNNDISSIDAINSYLDLGNLLLINKNPIEKNIQNKELNLFTQNSVQYLFNKIFSLPRKIVQDATCVTVCNLLMIKVKL
jgi:hypothetical protein